MPKLPLPFQITDPPDAEAIQADFDAIASEFPLSRKNMTVETPRVVGASGQPTFQGAWVNYDVVNFRGARFWKDALGMVYVEGLVKSGVIGTTIFILPAGYRPGGALIFPADTNTGHGRVDVAPTGNIVSQSGGNTLFSLSAIHFKQEQ